MKVYVFGAGKVGKALSRSLRHGGASVTLRARRRGLPQRGPRAELVVLAVRDHQLAGAAEALAESAGAFDAVVHCAGALGPDAVGAVRRRGASAGKLHPLLAIAGRRDADVAGAFAHVDGDPRAVRLASRAAKIAGMRPFTTERMNHALYHACAALLANGGAALAAVAAEGLERAGCPPRSTPQMLGALLESVGRNLQGMGLPGALTGPVRRGDHAAIASHLATLAADAPELLDVYRALARAQLPLAHSLGEAKASDFRKIEALLRNDP